MALTEPIRDKNHLKMLAQHFISRREFRNHLLMIVCLHTALRISDVLKLKWNDVYCEKRKVYKSHITLSEGKTGKSKTIALHPNIIEALKRYFPQRRGEFLFDNGRKNMAAISRVQAWRILSKAAELLELGVRVSAHALRKAFGYHAWKQGVSPVVLMHIFNHSSYDVTRRYLGLEQDDTDTAYLNIILI